MRFDKSHNLSQIGLVKSHNLTMLRLDLGMSSGIKLIHKLAKSLIRTCSKVHDHKTYNKAINNLIYKNK